MEDYSKKRFWSGGIYGQSCGGYWYPLILEEHAAAQQAMKPMGEWNRVTIHAQGDTVKTWLNGVPVAHFKWEQNNFKKGFFGLQIHSGNKGKVHFRGMKVKEL